MNRRQDSRAKNIGKNVWTATVGQVAIKPFQIRQAAAKDNDLRVENVDDAGKRAPEPGFVAAESGFANEIAGLRRSLGLEATP